MEKHIDVMAVMQYCGHSLGQNSNVNLTLKADYSELTKTVMLMQMLNNDVTVKVKMPEEGKPFKLGIFRIKSATISGDGESKIKLNSMTDFVEVDNLNRLVTTDRFVVKFETDVEIEEEREEE